MFSRLMSRPLNQPPCRSLAANRAKGSAAITDGSSKNLSAGERGGEGTNTVSERRIHKKNIRSAWRSPNDDGGLDQVLDQPICHRNRAASSCVVDVTFKSLRSLLFAGL